MAGILSAVFQPVRVLRQSIQMAPIFGNSSLVVPETFSFSSIRNKVRCYFPRPNEVKRVRKHGWNIRMSTPNGRRIIMRRLLKGRHVLSH